MDMDQLSNTERHFQIGLDIFVLCISCTFFTAVFVFEAMSLQKNSISTGTCDRILLHFSVYDFCNFPKG